MPARKVHHFVIEGEFLTERARLMVLSETPGAAWRFLRDSLLGQDPGTTSQVAIEVLKGESRLIGDSSVGVEVEDEKDARLYLKQKSFIYSGRVRIEGAWYRPYKQIQSTKGIAEDFLMEEYLARFMGHGRRVVRIRKGDKTDFYLFEAVGEPPFWEDEKITTVEEAIADCKKAGRKIEVWDDVIPEGESDPTPPPPKKPRVTKALKEAAKKARDEEQARLDAKYAEEDRIQEERIEQFRAQVRKQAEEQGLPPIVLELEDGSPTEKGTLLEVPRAPFMHWALRLTKLGHLAPPWKPVAPSGLKMPGDNVYHTDWILGAGLSMGLSTYDSLEMKAAYRKMYEIVTEVTEFQSVVLSEGKGKAVEGTVGKDILVVPDAHPSRVPEMLKAKAVITEMGGMLMHLAIVARENKIAMFLMPGAVKKIPPGSLVFLDPKTGEVRIEYRFG